MMKMDKTTDLKPSKAWDLVLEAKVFRKVSIWWISWWEILSLQPHQGCLKGLEISKR